MSGTKRASQVPSALQQAQPKPEGGVSVVTVPDPEEEDRRGDTTRPEGPKDGPTDTDTAFADIVAGWQTEPDVPRWPAEEDVARATSDSAYPSPSPSTGPHQPGPHQPENGDEDHYEPPDPPPFPVPQPRTLGGLALLAVGILLLVQPSLLSVSERTGTLLSLLALTSGIGWLVLGLHNGPPAGGGDPEGWDDGARV